MKMDLQTFAEPSDPNKGQQNPQPSQQPNENHQQQGQSDDLNKKLSNAVNQFQGMTKKMTDFFDNQSKSKTDNTQKPSDKGKNKQQSTNNQHENKNDGYEERISNLEKQLQDQQDKSNKNDLAKYTQQKIKDSGLAVDNDTFQHLQGATKDAIDKNIDWYKGLADKFNKPNQPAPKKLNNNHNKQQNNNTNIKAPKPKSFENGIGKFLK